jgi:SAM-dependent methyltransferase
VSKRVEVTDPWAQWLHKRRHGGDTRALAASLTELQSVRDRVLRKTQLREGDTLLDVGSGDGLIAFGGLEQVGKTGKVIFSDVSRQLLDHCRELAREARVAERCEFVQAAAEDLNQIQTASVHAVTTRSVLIFVLEKAAAFGEFERVLRPGGRISIWEPINSLTYPEPDNELWGHDVAPIRDLADRIKVLYRKIQGPAPAMMGFDERDLLAFAEAAKLAEIHLSLRRHVGIEHLPMSWQGFLSSSTNPLAPIRQDVINEALKPAERQAFEDHVRPQVEAGNLRRRVALAHLWAEKPR